jgi:RND family efflux transporter MFP subunit
MKKIFFKSVFVVVAVSMVSCGAKKDVAKQRNDGKLPLVEVKDVYSCDVVQENVFTGTVEADVKNNIAPQQPSRIKEIKVEVGDYVKKGDLLVTFDKSSLEQIKVQLENAKDEYLRTKKLYEAGGAAKSALDARRMQYNQAQSTYNNLMENTTLISPISGIVTARNYDVGDMYSGAMPVLVVEQFKPVKIKINVSESLFSKVELGMPVYVTLDAYGDEKFEGKVSLIYPTIDVATHTFKVEVSVANKNERVRPGMFARVTLPYDSRHSVVVPDSSIQKMMGSGDHYVFVYNQADSTVRYSHVKLGRRMCAEYEVLSGVESGETVVTAGHVRLIDGCKAVVVE